MNLRSSLLDCRTCLFLILKQILLESVSIRKFLIRSISYPSVLGISAEN